jgi:trimethylamine--corrinoid protein Co-methyltransferase
MTLEGFVRRTKPFEILNSEQIEKIHDGTLEILQETGLIFQHEKALEMFNKAGCNVDREKKIVKIPSSLVEESIRKCPDHFLLQSREPEKTLRIGGNRTYMMTCCGMETIDLETWERRTPTMKDQNEAVVVCDALENAHSICTGPYFRIEEIPPPLNFVWIYASQVRNSTKMTFSSSTARCEKWNIKIAKATEQQVLGLTCASSPLTYQKDDIAAAFEFAEAGFPVRIDTGPLCGATSPVTLAGSIVQANAELLAGVVLMQLIKPGIGIIGSIYIHPMEMRSGIPVFGAIERALGCIMFYQVWRGYGIPTWGGACNTSGKLIDYQAGYEKSMQLLLQALSGPNILALHGGVFGELTYHPVASILDDDIAGIIGRTLAGTHVDEEDLALELMKQVGPIPGHYLNKNHTRTLWKKEFFVPRVADRSSYQEWIQKGKKDALQNAKERFKEILSTHKPLELPTDQDKEVTRIFEEAREWYKKGRVHSDKNES